MSYFLATNPAPLNDALMVKIDGLLRLQLAGFLRVGHQSQADWRRLDLHVRTVCSHRPCWCFCLSASSIPVAQIALLPPISCLLRLPCAFSLWFRSLDPSSISTIWICPGRVTSSITCKCAIAPARRFRMDDLRGIVSFPSFHVSGAVIITYFLRGLPVVFPLAIVVNIGMSIGALFIGGHYLSDAPRRARRRPDHDRRDPMAGRRGPGTASRVAAADSHHTPGIRRGVRSA